MINKLFINIVTEDALSAAVFRRLILESGQLYEIRSEYGQAGKTYIDRKLKDFNNASKALPFFVLRDLDTDECAPLLVKKFFPFPQYPNLLFRIAVREVEAWLLADIKGFSSYLGISAKKIPSQVETIMNPKEYLINLARKSRKRDIKNDIVPYKNSTAKQGRNYNNRLIDFVNNFWDMKKATENSDSLLRAFLAIQKFIPLERTT
ncbi:MAG: hypothetical protein Q8O92_05115 [Candidatus Latescibacter sp.]|nr:hypothetical protein [Candidatus Latescibacter sp.]